MPEHDSRLERHAQSAATRRVAQRAHVDAEFRSQRLKGPQPSGVFPGPPGPEREALERSQAAFAAELGVSPDTYRVWDSGRRPAPARILNRARSRASSETPERRTRVVGDRKSPVPSGVAESADVHTDQDGENTKGKGFLVVPIRNECATLAEGLRRHGTTTVPSAHGT